MLRSLRRLALFGAMALVGALWSTDASAQVTTGAIGGRVTDEAGTNLEGVQIQVRNSTTGATRTGVTSAAGTYLVLGLEIGSGYDVTARRIGFEPITKRDQNVTIGQTTRVDFQMTARATVLQGQVIVSEIDPVITGTRTGVGSTVSDSALQRLPSLGRNFTDFVALTPQVSNSGPGLSGGGANNRYNNIQIDGATESDLFGLGSTGQPGGQARGKSIGIDAVKQYQVLLSPYDVRYGNFAGALINAVTKNGTNDLQGTAYVFYRDQSMTRSRPYLSDFEQQQYGFSLGGPVIKDKVHFFVNAELQEQSAPASGPYVGLSGATNLPSDATLTSYNNILNSYGLPQSGGGSRVNDNPLTNVFVRFDIQDLPFNSSLVVRHNYGEAQDDNFSRSFTGTTFPLLNNAYAFTSRKGSSVVQLRSNFANGWYNEVIVGLTTIRDRRTPEVRGPQITATMGGFSIVSGSERFSHGNELDQDILEITDNLVIPMGKHRLTLGTSYSTYKARNLFAQSIFGVWSFDTEALFQAGTARQYIVGVPICPPSDPGCDGAVRFKSSLFSLYAQDDWNVTPWFNVQAGVRFDAPSFQDKPPTNPTILADFDRNTADVPSGNGTISPRFGFNWDMTHDQRNQLRGGVGLFAGRPAYVWLGNAFQNSGMGGVGLLTCNPVSGTNPNGGAPVFNTTNIATPPTACAGGLTAALGSEINLLKSDLKFPQNARVSLGYDRDLGNGLIATAEILYTNAVNSLFYTNIALQDAPIGYDRHGRAMYGTAPVTPTLKVAGRGTVLDVSNQSRDKSWQYTAGLQRRWRGNWEGSIFYTFSRVRDVQSLSSSTAFSQYRFGRPAGYLPQTHTGLGRSLFEQPHRIVANASYTFQKTGTTLSTVYFGESGQRFHYLYGGGSSGDLNGDGIGNDLIYIPNNVNDPNEIIFRPTFSTGGVTYTAAQQATAFDQFISSNACLNNQRGRIMARHSCEEPWRNLVNVSVRQSIGALGLGSVLNTNSLERLTVQLDIFNFANFINSDWGHVRSVGFGGVIPPLNYDSKEAGSMVGPNGARPTFTWNPTYKFSNSQNVSSNYRMQLSIRYSF